MCGFHLFIWVSRIHVSFRMVPRHRLSISDTTNFLFCFVPDDISCVSPFICPPESGWFMRRASFHWECTLSASPTPYFNFSASINFESSCPPTCLLDNFRERLWYPSLYLLADPRLLVVTFPEFPPYIHFFFHRSFLGQSCVASSFLCWENMTTFMLAAVFSVLIVLWPIPTNVQAPDEVVCTLTLVHFCRCPFLYSCPVLSMLTFLRQLLQHTHHNWDSEGCCSIIWFVNRHDASFCMFSPTCLVRPDCSVSLFVSVPRYWCTCPRRGACVGRVLRVQFPWCLICNNSRIVVE